MLIIRICRRLKGVEYSSLWGWFFLEFFLQINFQQNRSVPDYKKAEIALLDEIVALELPARDKESNAEQIFHWESSRWSLTSYIGSTSVNANNIFSNGYFFFVCLLLLELLLTSVDRNQRLQLRNERQRKRSLIFSYESYYSEPLKARRKVQWLSNEWLMFELVFWISLKIR